MPSAASSANIGASSSRSSSANSMRASDGTALCSSSPRLPSVATYARNPDAPASKAERRAAMPGTRSRTKSGDPTATKRPFTTPVTPRPAVSISAVAIAIFAPRDSASATITRASR